MSASPVVIQLGGDCLTLCLPLSWDGGPSPGAPERSPAPDPRDRVTGLYALVDMGAEDWRLLLDLRRSYRSLLDRYPGLDSLVCTARHPRGYRAGADFWATEDRFTRMSLSLASRQGVGVFLRPDVALITAGVVPIHCPQLRVQMTGWRWEGYVDEVRMVSHRVTPGQALHAERWYDLPASQRAPTPW